MCDIRQPIAIPKEMGAVHHEIELAVLIGQPLKQANEDRVDRAIAGFGVGLDLTLRDLQKSIKKRDNLGRRKVKSVLMVQRLCRDLFR